MRLNNEHYELIIHYAEKYPEIITNKFVGLNAREKGQKVWNNLANQLNALGYGSLTVTEYKRRITYWKSKVKAKRANNRQNQAQTGSGEGWNIPINKTQERLLLLIGHKAYDGDNVKEMAFPDKSAIFETKSVPPSAQLLPALKPETQPRNARLDLGLDTRRLTEMDEANEEIIIIQNDEYETLEMYDREAKTAMNTQPRDEFEENTTQRTPRKTPSISKSTSRRKRIHDLTGTVQEMNGETLEVLKSIDNNLGNINTNLSANNSTLQQVFQVLNNKH